MSRGNGILVSTELKGRFVEGICGAGLTIYPGTVAQIQPATSLVTGRHTWEVYNADADGGNPKGPHILVIEDSLQGRTPSDPYTAGERMFGYIPMEGDDFNGLIKNESGTADDHTKGEILIIDDTTGKFIATTGSPEQEVAQLNETITDPTADTLAWMTWQG